MNELNQQDWEQVNAYHDGELGEVERRDLEIRLRSEPRLRAMLERVVSVSASLQVLRPATQPTGTVQNIANTNLNWRPARLLAGGAIAAAVALAVILAPRFSAEPSIFDFHAEFASQPFSVEAGQVRLVLGGSNVAVPDLLSANLTAVALRQVDTGSVAHYAGRNGCRLSYFRGAFGLDDLNPADGNQVATWSTTDDTRHMIVATGMDQDKFDAIAEYLKFATRQQASEQMMASLANTTANAERCVG